MQTSSSNHRTWHCLFGGAGLIWLGAFGFAQASDGSGSGGGVDFGRQILPILSDNCFACHGPDQETLKAGLRLDLEEKAHASNEYGDRAIVPGDVASSLLVERITATEAMDLMPPPSTGKKLSGEQVELLKQWVSEGGRYVKHWSFVPPTRPTPPEVDQERRPRNSIDNFVLAQLEKEGVAPAKKANKRTLARRVTLDLTGLPPTPQEVETFLNDKDPNAYERLVDRLLESPRFGEHLARDWMDAARYADSHGFHIDAERHLWKWRSWVIEAFNRNLPYDQFSTEQLAGDLLPEATPEQKVASGFLRNNMSTGEGGAIVEEYQSKYTFDRTETASTIWLGLTMTCARCHTHKYDPITHDEYYQLYAFFNNLDEAVMDGNEPNPEPFLKLPTPTQTQRLDTLRQQIDAGQTGLDTPRPEADVAREAWRREWRERLTAGLSVLRPTAVVSRSEEAFEVLTDGAVQLKDAEATAATHEIVIEPAAGRLGGIHLELLPESVPGQGQDGEPECDTQLSIASVEAELVKTGGGGGAHAPKRLKLVEAFASSWEGDEAPGRLIDGDPKSTWVPAKSARGIAQELFLRLEEPVSIDEGDQMRVRLTASAGPNDEALRRFRLRAATDEELLTRLFPERRSSWKVLGPLPASDPAAGLAQVWGPEESLDLEQKYPGVKEEIGWSDRTDLVDGKNHLLVNALHGVHGVYYLTRTIQLPEERTVEFRLKADDLFRLWVDGEVAAERLVETDPGDPPDRVRLTLGSGEHRLLLKIANLQGACYFAYDQDLNEPLGAPGDIAGRLLVTTEQERGNSSALRRYHLRATDPEWKELDDQVRLWKEARDEVDRSVVTTMVAKERKEPRETRILLRGEYDQPGEVVRAGVPAILPPLPAGVPTNRLGLARWLMDPSHPLTARVTVNRFWQHYFGIGLVKTAEDFGVQGERPSHPELLDWLATEFIESGWDIKHMQKLIVMSATYRQSSVWRPELAERDPENRLLARGPRFRVDAEVLRDNALAMSGLLVERVGSNSVRPYEPPGLWEAVSFNNSQKYVQDLGQANYQRSLYTHWKRQSPPPSMLLFDAPSREYCVVRRPRTNTPLQAMVLLNDPQFVEAARAFAWRVMQEGGPNVRRRLRYAFELATARRPNQEELVVLMEAYQDQLAAFRDAPDSAREFLQVGAFRPNGAVDDAELAAWTAVATLLMNLDETLTKG